MKVIIASGIFPPDIGGPATYLESLAFELINQNIEIEVITYSDYQKDNSNDFPVTRISRNHILPLRYFLYFWKLFLSVRRFDIIYAHDLFSSGIPAALVKKILGKRLVIRLGGDFLWEKTVNRDWTKRPLVQYYQEPKNYLERLFIKIGEFVLKSADIIIFSTDWQKEIYLRSYQLNQGKIRVIENPFPEIEASAESVDNKKIIFAGRLIKLKNLDFLINAFKEVLIDQPDLQLEIIGEGPVKNNLESLVKELNLTKSVFFKKRIPHQQLIEEIKQSFLVILPSLTEISPNLALECIKIKKPFLLTKETGFYKKFKERLIFIDPFNRVDLEKKIIFLLDKENYQRYQEALSLIPTDYSWPAVAKKHISIFNQILNAPVEKPRTKA